MTRKPTQRQRGLRPWTGPALLIGAVALVAAAALWWFPPLRPASPPPAPLPDRPTFTRDVAPLVFAHCSGCHRPGQSAPFDLLSFDDCRKRARQIAEVVGSRFMPPWMPAPGPVAFRHDRRLTDRQIALISRWVDQGAPQGDPAELPDAPSWPSDWILGPPDLVATLPVAYELPSDGQDIYRNFVISLSNDAPRFVRAFEFRPETRVIHHAFLRIDPTEESRQRDRAEEGPGFGGMDSPVSAESPSGFFISWQPGRPPFQGYPGLAWELPARADLVLQLHLQPSGKPEPVRPIVGLHFTDQAPTNMPFKIGLSSYAIDIPAGARDYAVEDSYVLPIDADVLALLPHAHYLGNSVRGWAQRPDGSILELIHIPAWDFNWQADYQFEQGVSLPRGTRLFMRWTYDNSTNNVRNPFSPPRPVGYGLFSTDEMGELWIQLLPSRIEDRPALVRDYTSKLASDLLTQCQWRLQRNPRDADAHFKMGNALLALGRVEEGIPYLRQAIALEPSKPDPHFHLGLVHVNQGDLEAARRAFESALDLDPAHFKARNNLAVILMRTGQLDAAAFHLQEVLRQRPDDALARRNLERIQEARGIVAP